MISSMYHIYLPQQPCLVESAIPSPGSPRWVSWPSRTETWTICRSEGPSTGDLHRRSPTTRSWGTGGLGRFYWDLGRERAGKQKYVDGSI